MCQDYMYSITKHLDAADLRRAGVELVIIGNGSSGMIKSYRSKSIICQSFPISQIPSPSFPFCWCLS